MAALSIALDLHQYLSIGMIKAQLANFQTVFRSHPVLFVTAFMLLHITTLTLCLPGAVLSFALLGGAMFGPLMGTAIVLVSLTIGDSLGFLLARYVLRDWVRSRVGRYAREFDRGIEKDGSFYLISLRLMAVIPYFVVNLAMGLTRMPLKSFAPMSFLGLAPSTVLYVIAGAELARIEEAGDVLSIPIIFTFVLLGLLPVAARYALRRRREHLD